MGFIKEYLSLSVIRRNAKSTSKILAEGWKDQFEAHDNYISNYVVAKHILSLHPDNYEHNFIKKLDKMLLKECTESKDITPRDTVWLIIVSTSLLLSELSNEGKRKVDEAIKETLMQEGLPVDSSQFLLTISKSI